MVNHILYYILMTIFIVCAIVFSFFAVAEIILFALACYARLKGKKHKKIVWIIYSRLCGAVFGIIAAAGSVFSAMHLELDTVSVEIMMVTPESVYTQLVAEIQFEKVLICELETEWEIIINAGLGFNEYVVKSIEEDSPCKLLEEYYYSYADPLRQKQPDTEQLYDIIEKYSGTDILPVADKTLDEITADTLPIGERMNTDPEEFKKETYLRCKACKKNPSGNNYYQAGRAADDVVKTLVESGNYTLKELLFYSYLTVSFYQLSMNYSQKEVDNCFVEYRTAMIYIYLYKFGGYDDDYDYNRHFLLSAGTYMRLAKEHYSADTENINEALPDCDYYYSSTLNNFITLFHCDNREIKERCALGAKDYIDYAGVEGKYYKECKKYVDEYEIGVEG